MELLLLALQAFGMRDWYIAVGACLTLAVQVLRKQPWLRDKTWARIPDGARFLVPLLVPAVLAFCGAWATGAALSVALLHAVGAALGIGVPSMGFAAGLKESPAKWDGGKGGK